ncbi:MAG: hypothetical protein DRM98_04115, partial [Thermoplasmata archaeon]
MEFKEKNNIIFLRLFPNENINDMIIETCKKTNVKTAVILSGIGQVKNVQLGYFKEKGNYSEEIFIKPFEILSLTGNIIKQDDEYLLHIHAVLGDENKKTIGGHFINGVINVTGEIVIL